MPLPENTLCAERYERDLKDIFAIQDEITMKVLTSLRVKLTEGEKARACRTGHEKPGGLSEAIAGI